MTHEEIKQNILTLGEDYKAGKMNYTDYKSQYDKLAKKWAKLCKPKSFGEIKMSWTKKKSVDKNLIVIILIIITICLIIL